MVRSPWTRLPALLVSSRIVWGPLVCYLAVAGVAPLWILTVLLLSMASDIFDGVIARRLGIADAQLRVADGRADGWFFLWVGAVAWMTQPAAIRAFFIPLAIEATLQLASCAFDFAKYGRITSFHAYTAKAWGFSLYLAAIGLLVFHSSVFLWFSFGMGILSAVDSIGIKIILPEWRHDVLSTFHALALRKESPTGERGKEPGAPQPFGAD